MIRDNLLRVRDRIARACQRANRNPDQLTLVVVSKEVAVDKIKEAQSAGVKIVGENRVQEALEKIPVLPELEWHMIGHLQTNKVKKAVGAFKMIQSVDSFSLAQEIDRRATQPIPVLVEVNTSGEASKFGVNPDHTARLVEQILTLEKLRLQGLMTIGPGWAVEDSEASRQSFKLLFSLRETLSRRLEIALPVLSMGMSSDFEVGIEEGSTMVRIGTLIFGPRA